MTKKQLQMLNNYNYAREHGYIKLWDCYNEPSYKKQKIYYDYCLAKYLEDNGEKFCIPTHNTFTFTFAYQYIKITEDNKTERYLKYITPSYDYDFRIDC